MSRDNTQIAGQRTQYILQLVQVFFVGLTLGMTRTVVPAVAESDFGVPKGDLALISTFVIAFGLVKGLMNFVAGAMSETFGRKPVLIVGWLIAMPIPWMIWYATTWWWIVAATGLLGVNQGLTWSMTLTSKLDLARAERRGLSNGLNEFSGYLAVAVAGIVTGYLSDRFGARLGLLAFGYTAIVPALFMASVCIRETRDSSFSLLPTRPGVSALGNALLSHSQGEHFRRRNMIVLCQCGLFEKFIDCTMWFVLPVYLTQRGIDLKHIGWAPGVYAATWGCLQILTGPLSDRIGRKCLIVGGMLLCALGVAVLPMISGMLWWMTCAAMTGIGMAMLYPTLGAAVSDLAPAHARGKLLGVYRFWRDLGYAAGAAFLALTTRWPLEWSFVLAGCIAAIAAVVVWIAGDETRPAST